MRSCNENVSKCAFSMVLHKYENSGKKEVEYKLF